VVVVNIVDDVVNEFLRCVSHIGELTWG
jgi:hypothetical protein